MTKRLFFIFMLMAMFLSTSALAWNSSFRSRTSGSLLLGDFDNDLDPIWIHNNSGYRFYTILSNLTSGSNAFMEGSTNDHRFLLGSSGQFGIPQISNWTSRSSLVIQLADETTPHMSGLDLNLDGYSDTYGSGELNGTAVEEENWDSDSNRYMDGIVNTSHANAYQILKARDWQFTHSYTDSTNIIGLSIARRGYGENYLETNLYSGSNRWLFPVYVYEDGDFSYNNSETITDYEPAVPVVTDRDNWTGEFSNIMSSPTTIIRVAYQRPFPPLANSNLRFDVTYSKFTSKQDITDKVSTSEIDFNDPAYSLSTAQETYTGMIDRGGSHFVPSVRLAKNWTPSTYSWFKITLGFGGNDYNSLNKNYYHSYDSVNYGSLAVQTRDWTVSSSYTGEEDYSSFDLYHKTVHEFSSNFVFAAGFEFSKSSVEAENVSYVRDEFYRDVIETYDGLDNTNDWVRTRNARITGNRSQLDKTTSLTLPVAMEYALGKWTFRLGGSHSIYKSTHEFANVDNGLISMNDTTVYGDGTGGGPGAIHPDDDFDTIEQKYESKGHQNTFWYGLQFMPNQNLKIELMDFMSSEEDFIDSEFFSNLRMSFTLLF